MGKVSQVEVDEYGRVMLPKEILEKAGIQPNDYIYIEAFNGSIRKWPIAEVIFCTSFLRE